MRVLLVEDEPLIAAAVKQGMEEDRHVVDVAHDGTQGLRLARENVYGLIILDLMLPGTDGWTICRDLRAARNTTPILMLTARDAVQDRVQGLFTGADDYLTKPFDIRELRARVHALLRRSEINKTPVIRIADLVIDSATRTATRGHKKVTLTGREFSLLEALARNEGRILTRELIQERVWVNDEIASNAVEVYIRTLRKKIDDEHEVKLIHTIRGVGYSMRAPGTEEQT